MINGDERDANDSSGVLSKIRANPWIMATVFLAVVLVVVVIFRGSIMTGNVVSEKDVSANLLSFVKAQGDPNAQVTSLTKEGSLYLAVVDFKNQSIPVYVTLDGAYLVSNVVPLNLTVDDTAPAADTATNTQTPQKTPAVTKSDKPVVELFVMALCPYGTQAEKGIIPVVELLKSKIDFKMKFVSYAMHGKTEIDENTRQYCIQKEQTSKYLTYLSCYVGNKDSSGSDSCLTIAGVDKTKLNSCISAADKAYNITANFDNKASWLNGNYPVYAIDAADNKKYGVQGSPTLVINGAQASSARDPASLLKTICAAFNTAPSECSQTLSSASPSPGFGTATAAASSGSAGGCGG